MNYGKVLAWSIVVLSLGASIGYLLVHDYRRSLYYFFAAAITSTISY